MFLESKTPSQERLISCFLEGLRDKQLYTHLFAKEHTDFDECCFDAQRFDDNCEFLAHRLSHDASESSDTVRNANPQMIADLIVRKL